MNEQLRLVGDQRIAEPVASPIATALCGTCEQCGKSFTPRAGSGGKHQRFCSSECRQRWHTANPNVAQRGGSHVGGDELTLAKPPLEENLTSGFRGGQSRRLLLIPIGLIGSMTTGRPCRSSPLPRFIAIVKTRSLFGSKLPGTATRTR